MKKTIASNEYKALVDWLIKARQSKGYTMRDLAVKLDRPHSYVGKIEQLERRLDVIEFVEYCNALKLDPVDGIALVKQFKPRKI